MPDRRPPSSPTPRPIRRSRRPDRADELPDRPPAAAGSVLRPSAARSSSGVLLARSGFAAVTQVRVNEVDDTYAGFREQDLIDVLNGLAGTAAARRGRDRAAREHPRRPALAHQPARGRADAGPQQADTLEILAGTGPGHRPRRPDHHRGGRRRGRRRLVARHRPGAAQRRCRGDADQRRGPGRRADLVRGGRRAASWSTAGCSRRPTSSTSSATRTPARGRWCSLRAPSTQLEDDGADGRLRRSSASLDITCLRNPSPRVRRSRE